MSDKIAAFKKSAVTPYVCLTAYTTNLAGLMAPHVDLILVGDSVAQTIYGAENTLEADVPMMIRHGRAVRRGAPDTVLVVDMPAGSYEEDAQAALRNAREIMQQTNCDAVKLEGGADFAATIALLVQNNIPVMGHIGLMPQSVIKEGGYKIKGKSDEDVARLIADAKAIEAAGVFSFVLEGTIDTAAQAVTDAVTIPVIGIGASPACDGQILVCDDMLGLTQGHVPKFVKQYAQTGQDIAAAIQSYADDVRTKRFPEEAHLYRKKIA